MLSVLVRDWDFLAIELNPRVQDYRPKLFRMPGLRKAGILFSSWSCLSTTTLQTSFSLVNLMGVPQSVHLTTNGHKGEPRALLPSTSDPGETSFLSPWGSPRGLPGFSPPGGGNRVPSSKQTVPSSSFLCSLFILYHIQKQGIPLQSFFSGKQKI